MTILHLCSFYSRWWRWWSRHGPRSWHTKATVLEQMSLNSSRNRYICTKCRPRWSRSPKQ